MTWFEFTCVGWLNLVQFHGTATWSLLFREGAILNGVGNVQSGKLRVPNQNAGNVADILGQSKFVLSFTKLPEIYEEHYKQKLASLV